MSITSATMAIKQPVLSCAGTAAGRIKHGISTILGLATGRSRLRMPIVSVSEQELAERRRSALQARLERLKARQAATHRQIDDLLRQI